MATKFLPVDWSLTDEESKEQGRITPSQERAILLALSQIGYSDGCLIADEPGFGKAQPLGALVLTPSGYRQMGEMTIGQEVVSPDGATARVIGVYPQGERPVYRVTLRDGRSVEADEEHLWTVWSHNAKKRGGHAVQKTTRELLATLHNGKDRNANWYIEDATPVDLGGEWASSIDPYLLGLLLGDGGISGGCIMLSTADVEIVEAVRGMLPAGVTIKHSSNYDYRLTKPKGGNDRLNPVMEELRRLGLWGTKSHDKFVPAELLNSSRADRLALLQGLLDTDGAARAGGFEFGSMSPTLADNVAWLVRSLGGRASLYVTAAGFHRVSGRLPLGVAPFRLARKNDKIQHATRYPLRFLAIKSIEFVGMKPTQCIMVDSDLHEYVTDNFIRTHNTAIGAEIIKRARAWRRVLLIALPDTHKQWVERINAQSEGTPDALPPRVMNGTKAGKANYDAFMKHEEGIFIASSHFLVEKDWEQQPEWHHDVVGDKVVRFPVFKRDRKTGELELVARKEGLIGPAEEPVRQMKSTRLDRFARFSRKPLDAVLFDEVQVIANRKAKGRQTIYSIKAHFRVAMSGSFFLNRLENQWSVATWTWPGDDPETGEPWIIPAFQRWKDRYLLAEAVRGRGGKVLTTKYGGAITQVTGERIPGEFVSTLPAYIRREAEPVPEPLVIDVDPTPQQLAQIQDFERDLMIWTMNWEGAQAPLVADIPLVLLTRLRQAAIAELSIGEGDVVSFADDAASAKLAPLRWLLEERWGGQPAAIYTDSKIGAHFIERRMRRAGVDARAWTGDLTKPQRDEMKHAYMAGEFPYIIATVQSFGTGLDGFQTRANKVAWISRPQGNSALVDQAIRRFWRPGMTQQGGGFEQAVLRMRESTDFRTEEMLLAQAWANREAMNGGRLAA